LTDLAARRDALRQAASAAGADPAALLDAALTELDAALDSLAGVEAGDDTDGEALSGVPQAVRAERRLLHVAFAEAPVPLLLLEPDGTIRRASNQACELLGAPAGYATGKPLTVFVDLPLRAAVRTLLAAVTRTREPRRAESRLLTASGPEDVVLAVSIVELPDDPPLLGVSMLSGAPGSGTEGGKGGKRRAQEGKAQEGGDIKAVTRRMDMVMAVTRLLLDNSTFSEAVILQRCARLLAGELADWAIVDIERDGLLRRQYVAGPRSENSGETANAVRRVGPGPSSLPAQVHSSGKPVLLPLIDRCWPCRSRTVRRATGR
jgi:PAS domain-containing protein